jgi:hypothetical protein
LGSFIHHIGHFQEYLGFRLIDLGVRLINLGETAVLIIYTLITHTMTVSWSGRYRTLLKSALDGQ